MLDLKIDYIKVIKKKLYYLKKIMYLEFIYKLIF